ncbi:DNA-directed RNA polymerase subunit beta [Dirofilaria immitis]
MAAKYNVSFRPCVLYEWLRLLMRRSAAKQSNERRLLRPRLEVKEEEGFDRSDVKKALLESLYEQRKEERRKELEKELKRRGNHVTYRLTQKDQKRKGDEYRYNNIDKKQKESSGLKGRKEKARIEHYATRSKNLLKGKEKIGIQKFGIKEKRKAESLEVRSKDIALVKSREKTKIPEVIIDQREEIDEIIPETTNTIIEKIEHKNVKKGLDIETLPSTRDFVRFLSLDYSDDPEAIPKELRHFRALPLVPVPKLPW